MNRDEMTTDDAIRRRLLRERALSRWDNEGGATPTHPSSQAKGVVGTLVPQVTRRSRA